MNHVTGAEYLEECFVPLQAPDDRAAHSHLYGQYRYSGGV